MSGKNGAKRVREYSIPMAEGFVYNYAAKQVDDTVLAALEKLAKEAQLSEKFEELYNGAVINTGENRLVLHHLTRGQLGNAVEADGVDKRAFYVEQQERIAEFANKVHNGEITNAAGEKFTTVVQIGIGGSDLGPRAMYLALENWAKKNGTFKMEAKFISNVDPDDAAAEDKLATEKDVFKNPSMLDALIGVYERNVLGYPSTAVLPYSQALSRFPAHLQQADMESNSKSVNRFGEPVSYVTGPVIFGEPGTNGQHSFYQLLHQGTDIVPLQFIGFKNSQCGVDVNIQGSTSQQKLCANVAAQIVAFACGKEDENLNKNFKGGRPSSIIIGEDVSPASLGALLAHFENKIMFQGFLWNLNSFDQEGVQLGKVLAKRVLAHETDGALKVFSDLLNI